MSELKETFYVTKKPSIFKDKTIIVFGGTGTIGSLIVEYLKDNKPKAIRVFSNDENGLAEAKAKWGTNNEMRYFVGDIRDYERVIDSMTGVDYVFNCAAMKHVPFCEDNPVEALKTNVLGLKNIIQGCIIHKIKKLLHISTDKACEPIGVMGYTKAIGERLLRVRWSQNPYIDMVCVRLGNVSESRGSILPLVRQFQREDKDFPLTSPNMTRFFMEPEDVLEFIMLAFTFGGHGEIFIPKLNAINVLEYIQGKVGIIPYKEIGIREGEKMEEIMISEEELSYCIEKDTYWILPNKLKKV